VVAAHGGRIEVSSVPGRTEFVVRLPRSSDAGRPTVTPAARAAGATT
jgi:nitrogen-specific signal transduction histidine kinase